MTRNQFWNDVPRVQKKPYIPEYSLNVRTKPTSSKIYSFLQTLWNLFADYSYCSTIHGFKYMGERNRTLFERICWVVVVLASLIVCGHMITDVYKKFSYDPVIVSFSDQETPIWQVKNYDEY
jgi:acid-sensing ion channel, other